MPTAKSKRKPILTSTIKKLFAPSGNFCAFDNCPQTIIDDSNNVKGDICHIIAASPNGPRGDANKTPEELRRYENLILLCEEHHKEIDNPNNLSKYTITNLEGMKKGHEDSIRQSYSKYEINPEAIKKVYDKFLADTIANSHFRFEDMLDKTKKNIFIAGQNLYYITKNENKNRHKELAFEALEKGIKVRIMISDPEIDHAVQTWQFVTAEEYKDNLKHSVTIFKEWLSVAKQKRLNRIEIKKTDLVPITITFIDPEEDTGELVFIPVIYNPESHTRPCYSIKKKERPYIFDYYWKSYEKIFTNKAIPL